jgi:hypothetical protein
LGGGLRGSAEREGESGEEREGLATVHGGLLYARERILGRACWSNPPQVLYFASRACAIEDGPRNMKI